MYFFILSAKTYAKMARTKRHFTILAHALLFAYRIIVQD